jgi:hypothetical protein
MTAMLVPLTHQRSVSRPPLTLVTGPGRSLPPPPTVASLRRLLTGVLEVLDHRRPAWQLAGMLPCGYQRALVTTALAGVGLSRLGSVHVFRTAEDVVDLCARVERGGRSQAMTGRLMVRGDRWEFALLALV